MVATCPNVAGLETTLLGKESNAVDHEHINLFSPDSIKILLKKCNFEIIELSTPGVLDIDLVRRAVKEERYEIDQIDPIIRELVKTGIRRREFQLKMCPKLNYSSGSRFVATVWILCN